MLRSFILLSIAWLSACTSEKKFNLLNPSNLESQFIIINPDADTLVRTAKGALLNIKKGTFDRQVRLELKEAYSIEDIVRAGLVTQTDGKPLTSGGMIYISNDQKLEPKKPIAVSIPTDFIDESMQLYKGEEKNGSINWTEPTDLSNNPALDSFAYGKTLFQSSCSSCHKLFGDGPTSPGLAGVQHRGAWSNKQALYAFTRNPAAYNDCYVDRLKQEYGYVMTGFPNLDDKALDALYAYVENETRKAALPIPENNYVECMDSCRVYDSLISLKFQRKNRREKMIIDNDEQRITLTDVTPGRVPGGGGAANNGDEKDVVRFESFNAIYYKFDIQSNGWYNVDDIIGRENVVTTTLKVNAADSSGNGINVFLVVPSVKLFVPGGALKGHKDQYGFFYSIPLPVGAAAYIFAISEADDKVLFDAREFTIAASQTYSLYLKPISKEAFQSLINEWKFQDLTIKTTDSRIRDKVKDADKDISKLDTLIQSLKPTNCNCNCNTNQTAVMDSIANTTYR